MQSLNYMRISLLHPNRVKPILVGHHRLKSERDGVRHRNSVMLGNLLKPSKRMRVMMNTQTHLKTLIKIRILIKRKSRRSISRRKTKNRMKLSNFWEQALKKNLMNWEHLWAILGISRSSSIKRMQLNSNNKTMNTLKRSLRKTSLKYQMMTQEMKWSNLRKLKNNNNNLLCKLVELSISRER